MFSGERVNKSDPRIEAYGDVDELNSLLGALAAAALILIAPLIYMLRADHRMAAVDETERNFIGSQKCNRCHQAVSLQPDCFGCHYYPDTPEAAAAEHQLAERGR